MFNSCAMGVAHIHLFDLCRCSRMSKNQLCKSGFLQFLQFILDFQQENPQMGAIFNGYAGLWAWNSDASVAHDIN